MLLGNRIRCSCFCSWEVIHSALNQTKDQFDASIGLLQGYRVFIGVIQGLYRDNGKENGNYYLGFREVC